MMEWSCSKFKDESGKTYFVSIERHSLPGGSGEASADLAVTDGAAAWTAQGAPSGWPLLLAPCMTWLLCAAASRAGPH